jgi:hypothetical protein
MPCSKLEVSTVQHGTLSGAGYLHQSLHHNHLNDQPVALIVEPLASDFPEIARHFRSLGAA